MPQGEAEVPGSDGGDVTAAGATSAKTNGKELSGTTAAAGETPKRVNTFRILRNGNCGDMRRKAERAVHRPHPHEDRMRLRPLSVSRNEKGD